MSKRLVDKTFTFTPMKPSNQPRADRNSEPWWFRRESDTDDSYKQRLRDNQARMSGEDKCTDPQSKLRTWY